MNKIIKYITSFKKKKNAKRDLKLLKLRFEAERKDINLFINGIVNDLKNLKICTEDIAQALNALEVSLISLSRMKITEFQHPEDKKFFKNECEQKLEVEGSFVALSKEISKQANTEEAKSWLLLFNSIFPNEKNVEQPFIENIVGKKSSLSKPLGINNNSKEQISFTKNKDCIVILEHLTQENIIKYNPIETLLKAMKVPSGVIVEYKNERGKPIIRI